MVGKERHFITAKLLGKRIYWKVRLLAVLATLSLFLATAILMIHRRSLRFRQRFEFPAWITETSIYQDPYLLFAIGVVTLTLALLGTRR